MNYYFEYCILKLMFIRGYLMELNNKFFQFVLYLVKALSLLAIFLMIIVNISYDNFLLGGTFATINPVNIKTIIIPLILFPIFIYLINRKFQFNFKTIFILLNLFFLTIRILLLTSFEVGAAGDSWYTINSGSLLLNNVFTPLQKGGYISTYSHQLGLLTILLPLIKLFDYTYFPYYLINTLLVQISTITFALVVRNLRDEKAAFICLILLNLFLPNYFYSFLIYGQVFGLFFISIAIYFYTKYKSNKLYSIFFFIFLLLAYYARLAILVWVIAFIIFELFMNHNLKSKITHIVVYLLIILFANPLLISTYNFVLGTNIGKYSMPSSVSIAIGQDYGINNIPGFYSPKYISYYYTNKLDKDMFETYISEQIESNVTNHIENGTYFNFLSDKYIFTWSEQDLSSMNHVIASNPNISFKDFSENNNLRVGSASTDTKTINLFGEVIIEKMFVLRNYEKSFILFVLLLSFIGSILNIKKTRNIMFLFELIIIGLPLLLLIIESQPRYTFMYTNFLIVYSVLNLDAFEKIYTRFTIYRTKYLKL